VSETPDALRSAADALAAGRPEDALGLLGDTDLAGETLRLWARAALEAGRVRELARALRKLPEGAAPEDRACLARHAALAEAFWPTRGPARPLEELAGVPADEGGLELARARAASYLGCGARELARRELAEEGLEPWARVLVELTAGDPGAVPGDLSEFPPWARARAFASRRDWQALRAEVEAWDLEALQRREVLEDLAVYGECLGRPGWTRRALERLAPLVRDEAGRELRYRAALAAWRTGDLAEARSALEELEAAPGWVGAASRELLVGPMAAGAEVSDLPPTWRHPGLGACPGARPFAAALARALALVGAPVDAVTLAARITCGPGDLTSCFELMDILAEDSVPAVQCELDDATLSASLAAGLPVVMRLKLGSGRTAWGVLAGQDPARGLTRVLLPETGALLDLPPAVLGEALAPMGGAGLVIGRPGEPDTVEQLRLRTSMALEALDLAARTARRGQLAEAAERLDKARRYGARCMPIWMLLTELRVLVALEAGPVARGTLESFLDEVQESWPGECWPVLARARYLLDMDEKTAAREVLMECVRGPAPLAEAWTELGDLEEERGAYDEAARAWWEAHRLAPRYARPREQLARHFRREGMPQVALALCESALEVSPKNPYNWEMLGILRSEIGAPLEVCEAALRHAMGLNPQRPYGYGFLCDLYVRAGRIDDAVAVLEEGVGASADGYPYLVRIAELRFDEQDFAGAIEAAERALQLRPGEAVPTALIGACHGRSGDLDRAADILRRATELDITDPWPVRELAIHLRSAGKLQDALDVLREGASRCPEDVGIRAQRALTYEADGDLARALDAAREALELAGPDQYEVVRLVARLAQQGGQFPVSEAVWRAAVSSSAHPEQARKQFLSFLLDVEAFGLAEREGRLALHGLPDDEEINAWYGYALVRLERHEEAVPWLRRALARAPEYPFARSVLLDALTEAGADAQAAEAYEASPGRLTPLGYECAFVAYARLGRLRDALRVSRKATMVVPQAAGFFHRRSARLLLDDLYDYEGALTEASAAVEAAPDDPRTHDVHAWALAARRRFVEAEAAMDQMVLTGADFDDLLRFRRYLAERRCDLEGEEACATQLAERSEQTQQEGTARYWWRVAAGASLGRDASGKALVELAERGGARPEDWAELAYQAAQDGYEEAAQACLRRAGERVRPGTLVARIHLAARAGDEAAALALADELISLAPNDHRGPELRAKLLLADGRVDAARAAALQGKELGGRFCPEANMVVGLVHLFAGEAGEAREPLTRAELLRSTGEATLCEALGRWAEGDMRGAEAALARFMADERSWVVDRKLARKVSEVVGLELAP
jgi:tetratricopeptide (TPR) repeat protein